MFNADFYPTPFEVFERMAEGETIQGRNILEPHGGKGDLVTYLQEAGARDVVACEIEPELRAILQTKCRVIGTDFLAMTSEQISHIQCIYMNPPFSCEEDHVLHAFDIAPRGCRIVSLCNFDSISGEDTHKKKRLLQVLNEWKGSMENLGPVFREAERTTNVNIGLIAVTVPGQSYQEEFSGFFMEEEQEFGSGEAGLMSYSAVRDVVNRYVEAVKIYDAQLDTARRLNAVLSGVFRTEVAITVTSDGQVLKRDQFKKDLQKSGWSWILDKMNLKKYATRGLREDINKFVEQQQNIPFTMRNIYHMLEVVVATASQRMDKALLEVFESVTRHYSENRYQVEGWKTNSHYMLNRRFILPNVCAVGWSGEVATPTFSSGSYEKVEDMLKALCYITGENYDEKIGLDDFIRYRYKVVKENGNNALDKYYTGVKVCIKEHDHDAAIRKAEQIPGARVEDSKPQWGQWIEWTFFRIRFYKKGTAHMEFINEDVWALFNQHISRIKGFPLFEGGVKKEKPKKARESKPGTPHAQTTVLFTLNV